MSAHLTLVVDRRRGADSGSAGDAGQAAGPASTEPDAGGSARKLDDRESSRPDSPSDASWVHAAWVPRPPLLGRAARLRDAPARPKRLAPLRGEDAERGAVTAEYAIVILAGVAFAGVLVAIMRSGEIRQMLVDLVQNALGSAG